MSLMTSSSVVILVASSDCLLVGARRNGDRRTENQLYVNCSSTLTSDVKFTKQFVLRSCFEASSRRPFA